MQNQLFLMYIMCRPLLFPFKILAKLHRGPVEKREKSRPRKIQGEIREKNRLVFLYIQKNRNTRARAHTHIYRYIYISWSASSELSLKVGVFLANSLLVGCRWLRMNCSSTFISLMVNYYFLVSVSLCVCVFNAKSIHGVSRELESVESEVNRIRKSK